MKKGRFISCPSLTDTERRNPWEHIEYNSYDKTLTPGDGILTVRKKFEIGRFEDMVSVTVRVASLGIFDAFLNGVKIFDQELKPGWTDYNYRTMEFETEFLSEAVPGTNVLTAEVSDGWWSGRISFGTYGINKPAFCCEIEITYEDGSSELIASDESWETCVSGPTLFADIWDGEYYDARIPKASELDDRSWEPAELYGYKGEIVPFEGEPIEVIDTKMPVSAVIHSGTVDNGSTFGKIKIQKSIPNPFNLTYLLDDGSDQDEDEISVCEKNAAIFDFGENIVGCPCIDVIAPCDARIEVFVAEMLNDSGEESRGNDGPEGSLYIKNYRSAMARCVYIANGDGYQTIRMTHTFYGFRYIEIRSDVPIEICLVSADVIGSNVHAGEIGSFRCSNPDVNKFYRNVVSGMKGNYLSNPTDCPQRDERLGWTGDTQVFCGAASYIGYIDRFMNKWLNDARCAQIGHNGAYCDVIPRVCIVNEGASAWADAGIIVPYRMWLMYNDVELVRRQYESMEDYMNFLSQFGYDGPKITYGDWLNYDVTDKRFIAVSYYAYDCELMSLFSRILGKYDRADYYDDLREKIVSYWQEKYMDGNSLLIDTQTGYLLALRFRLVPDEYRDSFISRLERKIIDNDYTLSTGFVGTGVLCQTLSEVGLDKLAYSLLLQTKDPSWLYSVHQGATTVWERWNSYTIERGFGDVGMNSFNHYAYGCVAEWLYSDMCGIKPDVNDPGMKNHVIIRPTPDFRSDSEIPSGQKRIDSASASYRVGTPVSFLEVSSGWQRSCGKMEYEICTDIKAIVKIMASDTVTVNGIEIKPEKFEENRAVLTLRPGKYVIGTCDFI